MWIVQRFGIGFAVASLAAFSLALVPQQTRADGGAGITFQTPSIIYSDDEDVDEDEDEIETLEATPERSAYSAPKYFVKFSYSLSDRLNSFSSLSLRADYTYATDIEGKTEESTAESTFLTTKYAYSANRLIRPEYRLRWRFPESEEYVNADEDEGAAEPVDTLLLPKIMYRFSTWVNLETLDVLDEEEEAGETYSFGLNLTDAQRENLERGFENFLREHARERVAKWLGDGVAEKFQERFGLTADGAGAEDQSGWNGARIYCGATCVGQYY